MSDATPHWEHGLRCHGYWLGPRKIGHVGLGPRAVRGKYSYAKDTGYECFYHAPDGRYHEWCAPTLRAGKRWLERMYLKELPTRE